MTVVFLAMGLPTTPIRAAIEVAADSGPRVGDVVARGALNGTSSCLFAKTDGMSLGVGEWLALRVGTDCSVTVTDAWEGSLTDGPDRFRAISIDAESGDATLPGSVAVTTATVCKTAQEHFFTYGFAGAAIDKLTHLWSSLTYCYNDSYVWGSSTAGSGCSGTPEPSWVWVVDWCGVTSQRLYQNTSSVWNQWRGDYHCSVPASFPCNLSDPDGYYHSLWDQVKASISGHSTCTHWWSGHIVLGPEADIVAGCV